MTLSENWLANAVQMQDSEKFAMFYVGAKGKGKGSVRVSSFGAEPTLRYDLAKADVRNLSVGLFHMASVLLAGGAEAVYPSVFGAPAIRDSQAAKRWKHDILPQANLSLTTVHAFSSCPIGENSDLTAANAFGKIHDMDNLYINDASMLPTSPGVNPQGTVMALARRNVQHFIQTER